jgi:hypothetical protein
MGLFLRRGTKTGETIHRSSFLKAISVRAKFRAHDINSKEEVIRLMVIRKVLDHQRSRFRSQLPGLCQRFHHQYDS